MKKKKPGKNDKKKAQTKSNQVKIQLECHNSKVGVTKNKS